jgi:hypothetical protein
MRDWKPVFKIMAVAGWLAASAAPALAQCAMCKAAVAGSAEAARMAGGMNLAVLVLLIPPVALFCAFMVVLYRYRKAPDEATASCLSGEGDGGAGAHLKEDGEAAGKASATLRAGDLTHA